jgi:hypothetical protein
VTGELRLVSILRRSQATASARTQLQLGRVHKIYPLVGNGIARGETQGLADMAFGLGCLTHKIFGKTNRGMSISAFATLRPLPSPLTGLPRLPEPPFRHAAPTTPADRAGARVDCFPARTAFPKWQKGRHPHCHFRGLLRLHSRYGSPDCSTA